MWERGRVPLAATVPFVPLYVVWAALLATGGGDLAAQDAWAGFAARHWDSAYNLFWYGGMHTANYSLLSPLLMAWAGVRTVAVVSGLAAGWYAARLLERAGIEKPVWPALLASAALWCDVASGRATFALGVAVGLAGCLAVTGGRPRPVLAAVLTALATMASPVAGLFLVVVGAGHLLDRRFRTAAALLVPPFAVVALTTVLFPFKGEQPMFANRVWPPALFGVTVFLLAPRGWRVLRLGAAAYAAGVVLTYLIPSPIGTNVERLAELVAPAVLLAAATAVRASRVRCAVLVVVCALSVNWVTHKTIDDLRVSTTVPAWAAGTQGVVAALERLGADRTRVEVVPARNHREASGLAPYADSARGWNRQLDVERGRLFYDGSFSPRAYRAWLADFAVGYVVVADGTPDGPAEQEAALVRSGPDWLEPVWKDAHWSIYRVRDAVPLVSPPATVVRAGDAELVLSVGRPGPVTVRVKYSPWLWPDHGCLAPDGGWTRLNAPEAGEYRLSSRYRLPWSGHC
ncbi:glycosyltransferase family 87 protein [Streptomyces sp. Li-HN-5-11]|nr:glycosyltransferase family 87 protein [Streptomyces sp. Li-HN-5-11]WNM36725.1 glycosyltransferase family 87 protein [Streptomyces sp. Li-HN-5-11]